MPTRNEILDTLSTNSTSEPQKFTRAYAEVIPGYTIEFRNRGADKTNDSHGTTEKDGPLRRVTFLAQDASVEPIPFVAPGLDNGGQLLKSLNTGLGAIANRLKPVDGEGSADVTQTPEFKARRAVVRDSIFLAALLSYELQAKGSSDQHVEDLAKFLYDNGNRIDLGEHALLATAENLQAATALNIATALDDVEKEAQS